MGSIVGSIVIGVPRCQTPKCRIASFHSNKTMGTPERAVMLMGTFAIECSKIYLLSNAPQRRSIIFCLPFHKEQSSETLGNWRVCRDGGFWPNPFYQQESLSWRVILFQSRALPCRVDLVESTTVYYGLLRTTTDYYSLSAASTLLVN